MCRSWSIAAIDLDEPVATYWPEYAQNGKEHTLVRQLLAHTAGVIGFDRMHEVVRHDGVGWGDLDRIAPRLAEDAPSYPPGTRHCYHALTIGWLLAELIRRVDGGALGRFFADEVAAPLGLDAWIGMPDTELSRVAHVHDMRLDHLLRPLRRARRAARPRHETRAHGSAVLSSVTAPRAPWITSR